AAYRDGLQEGDLVTHVSGQPVDDWTGFVKTIQANANQPLELQVERHGQSVDLQLTPGEKTVGDQTVGYIGASPEPVSWPEEYQRNVSYNPFDALIKGVEKTYHMIALTLESIWKMLEGVLSVKNLSGPITIAKVAGASAASGIEPFISFLAYLSISLGVLNLLPIPMLDGGHLLYYAIEAITGRPVSEKVQMIGLRIGMALIFSLMALAIVNDVMRL
ncbi:MAG: RIP metalloprotease RseP, partial [Pontibacterium sp.]